MLTLSTRTYKILVTTITLLALACPATLFARSAPPCQIFVTVKLKSGREKTKIFRPDARDAAECAELGETHKTNFQGLDIASKEVTTEFGGQDE